MQTTIVASRTDIKKTQETFVKTHAYLVKRIAYQLLMHLPSSILLEDLIQAGMEGLLEAARNYEATKGASFETYAHIRIRGSMLDEVRRNDWVPRSIHKNARMIAEAAKRLSDKLGRDAKHKELAQELQLDLPEFYTLLHDIADCQVFGFDDLTGGEDMIQGQEKDSVNPQDKIIFQDISEQLASVMSQLPAKEKMVLALYYQRDLNLKEIGDILNVSESRVSQLLTQATKRIKMRFTEKSVKL